MLQISVEELYMFHKIDREVFFRLVIRLARNPAQSLLVMAFWLWLENIKYDSKFLSKLGGLSDPLINAVANEAAKVLNCLEMENDDTPEVLGGGGGLPLTTILMQKKISLQLFRQKRFTTIAGIKCVLNKTCSRIFTDILQYILGSANTSTTHYRPLVIVPGFPHPVFGTFTAPPINFEEMDLLDPRVWIKMHPYDDGARDDDKTMFLTFSRGFPVTKEEVWHLFTNIYGDCIKFLNMGNENMTENQVLFAIMVLKNVEVVDQILNGKHVAKFRLNGKHIWARKYERRDYT